LDWFHSELLYKKRNEDEVVNFEEDDNENAKTGNVFYSPFLSLSQVLCNSCL
jgi:hypothetical protein